ncbi:unnamed protein product [Microthlaspi erraticum]|uniref:Uncharacterized protein n=1 Tax=Microthlaspi erraticum TaxID=1685480 RepID=A0A6D2KNC7_9BRAS|nr:unnamed protein product [Microthlaspi erraticum]
MALRRTLSLRSLLNPRRHQPSSCSFITRHEEKLDCQRSFSSSILYHRPRHSSDSLYPQLLVSLSVIIATCRLLVFLAQTRNADSVVQHVVASLTTAREKLVDALQQLFETVHSLTGFNWWASILLTTFLIRGLTIPAMIHMARFYSVATTLYFSWQKRKQTWMEIKDQHGGAPASYATSQKEIYKVVNNHMSSLTSLLALSLNLITPPIVIDMGKAVAQMTEKVPSLTTGGALWFTDLTRPDALYIFPILTGVLFWITVECDAPLSGFEGLPFIL